MGAAFLGEQGELGIAGIAAALYCIRYQHLANACTSELRQYGQGVEVPFAREGLDVGSVDLSLGEAGEERKGDAARGVVGVAGVADHGTGTLAAGAGYSCVAP